MFASKLRFVSPKGYRFTKKYLKLPGEHVLKTLISNSGFDEGINMAAIKALAISSKNMSEKDRVCCMFLLILFL